MPPGRVLDAATAVSGGPGLWRWAVAEVRLDEQADALDLAVCAARPEGAEAWRAEPHLPTAWGPHLSAILDAWADPADPLAASPYVWAELDGWSAGEPSLRPLVYPAVEGLTVDAVLAVAARAAAVDGRVPPGARAAWSAAVRALPPGARPMQLGLLPSRGIAGLRLFAAVPADDLADWLRAIAWPGAVAEFTATARALGRYSSHVELQMDFTPGPGDRVATEILFPSGGAPDPRWNTLLDALIHDGLVLPERARSLERWTRPAGGDPVPRAAQLKLGWGPGGPGPVKGYLSWGTPHG